MSGIQKKLKPLSHMSRGQRTLMLALNKQVTKPLVPVAGTTDQRAAVL